MLILYDKNVRRKSNTRIRLIPVILETERRISSRLHSQIKKNINYINKENYLTKFRTTTNIGHIICVLSLRHQQNESTAAACKFFYNFIIFVFQISGCQTAP